ncbi:MAG: 23S rRNA (pseudouridine(1915)-N(3))-methyltransferase RlmH [Paludibacteraceae bacterium]|nr:23S rRNA (pseudouridine(1915)-N(3))-methyltransferase RlmH [Paludibacteraceae bacterium]MBP6285156.1 23S rRNA (pseudouridine(1915)-N(3))-methyltransferase RlmH [Paludibacteraceae bacterium]
MRIGLIVVGKTTNTYLQNLITDYQNRLKHYVSFDLQVIPELKNAKHLSIALQKEKEGEYIVKQLEDASDIILLDEKGSQFGSVDFAQQIDKAQVSGKKKIVFVIGGPYGFSEQVYQKATQKISLSKMTFSHQMIRLIFVEQLYRAYTILNNEPYHHE